MCASLSVTDQIKKEKNNMVSGSGTMDNAKTKYAGWLSRHIYVRKDFPRVIPRLSLLFARETLDKLPSTLTFVDELSIDSHELSRVSTLVNSHQHKICLKSMKT